jgi:predicted PurR-regulated permease PerM
MNETAMWAIGIILFAMLSIIGFLVNMSLTQLKAAFNQLLSRIDKISQTLDNHNTDLIKILSRNEVQSQFIDGHTEDIEYLKREISDMKLNCASNNHRKIAKQ